MDPFAPTDAPTPAPAPAAAAPAAAPVEQRPELWPRPAVIDEPIADTAPVPTTMEWPMPLISYTQPRYSGLTSAVDIARRQAEADRVADAAARRSSMEGLTLRTALEDAREVLFGMPADLWGGDAVALSDLLLKRDRLRGLGVLLVALALVALAVL